MKEFASKFMQQYDSFNKWIKFLLALLWDIPTNLYRLCKSIAKDNIVGIVVAVLLLIFGGFWILWVIDLVTILFMDKIYWIDEADAA